MTSTLCEFLIHPGLFWTFSGKDAEKLTHREGSDEELLDAATNSMDAKPILLERRD